MSQFPENQMGLTKGDLFMLSGKPKFNNYGGGRKLCLIKGTCAAGDLIYEYLDYFTNYPENPGDKPSGRTLGQPNYDGYALIQPFQN